MPSTPSASDFSNLCLTADGRQPPGTRHLLLRQWQETPPSGQRSFSSAHTPPFTPQPRAVSPRSDVRKTRFPLGASPDLATPSAASVDSRGSPQHPASDLIGYFQGKKMPNFTSGSSSGATNKNQTKSLPFLQKCDTPISKSGPEPPSPAPGRARS